MGAYHLALLHLFQDLEYSFKRRKGEDSKLLSKLSAKVWMSFENTIVDDTRILIRNFLQLSRPSLKRQIGSLITNKYIRSMCLQNENSRIPYRMGEGCIKSHVHEILSKLINLVSTK